MSLRKLCGNTTVKKRSLEKILVCFSNSGSGRTKELFEAKKLVHKSVLLIILSKIFLKLTPPLSLISLREFHVKSSMTLNSNIYYLFIGLRSLYFSKSSFLSK